MKSKKQLFVTVLFSLIILFAISLHIPALDNLAIKYIEQFFHKTLRNPGRWIDIIQNTASLVVFTLAVLYFVTYIEYGIKLKSAIKFEFEDVKVNLINKNIFNLFLFAVLLLFVSYFNVIKANFFYADDVFRNYGGNRSWIGFSRYISEFCSIFIHNSLKLNDIAPLSQFIAILISASTIIILALALTGNIKISSILALSAIFIAPCYAENISYRFDSPYMAFSLFFAALPFLFIKDKRVFSFISIISLLLTCISYQAALSLYILCAIYIFVRKLYTSDDLKNNISFAVSAIISFIAALVIFKLFFMNKMTNEPDEYFSSQVQISAFFKNSMIYIRNTFFANGGLLSKALFASSLIYLVFTFVRNSKLNKFFSFIFITFVLIVSYVLSFGPYLIFSKPVFAVRAFMGFNVFIALILLAIIDINSQKKIKLPYLITGLSAYSFMVFMFTYGNCLNNQKEYQNFRLTMILNDLSEIIEDKDEVTVSFAGNMDLCQKNRIALKNYPVIKSLISRLPVESSSWNDELLNGYNLRCKCEHKKLTDDYKLMKDSYYHSIYKMDKDFIVVLK